MSEFIGARPVGTSFVVRNTTRLNRTLKFWGFKLNPGQQYNLLSLPAISEEDIRASLLKGDLYDKLRYGEIQVVSSDINLLQFNAEQKAFLEAHGITCVSEIDNTVVGGTAGSITTLVELSDLPGPTSVQSSNIYVKETGANYSFEADSVASVDDWTVIAPTGGTAGRWILIDDRVTFGNSRGDGIRITDGVINSGTNTLTCSTSTPFLSTDVGKKILVHGAAAASKPLIATIAGVINTSQVTLSVNAGTSVTSAITIFGTDISSALQTAFNATALAGVDLFLPPGRYIIGTNVVMPSNLHLIGTPLTTISSLMAQTGAETNNPLHTINQVGTASSTLAAPVYRGSRTISVTDNVTSVGSIVRLHSVPPEGNNQWYTFEAQAISGSGPYTVTLDRPVQFTYASGTFVDILAYRPVNIRIDGNDMVLDGSGDTAIQCWGVSRSYFKKIICIGHFANWAITCDLGSDRLLVQDMKVFGNSNGFACSSNELTTFERCDMFNSIGHGFYIWDGVDITVRDCRSNFSTLQGLNFSTNGNAHGGLRIKVIGGNYDSNAFGIILQCGSATAEDISVTGASIKYNRFYGIANLTPNRTLDVIDCDVGPAIDGAGGGAPSMNGVGGALPAVYANGGSRIRMRGGRVLSDGVTATGAINQMGILANDANTVIEVTGVDFQLDLLSPGVPNWISVGAAGTSPGVGEATISVDNIRMKGSMTAPGGVYGFGTSAEGTMRIGRVDIDAINAGTRYFGSGHFSRTSTVIANGAGTGQTIAWPNIKSTDRIEFRLITIGGTPTPRPPIYTISEGVSFAVTFAAGDTSTYEYIIY